MLMVAEFANGEKLPLHQIHRAVFSFLRDRDDAAVFGAQAVNLLSSTPRMTQDVDILATTPEALATALAQHLSDQLHAAFRVRTIKKSIAFRIYQKVKPSNRHVADIRKTMFPLEGCESHAGILAPSAEMLIALKLVAYQRRQLAPKGATDLADLRRLLILVSERDGSAAIVNQAVNAHLQTLKADSVVFALWQSISRQPLVRDEDVDEGY